MDEREAKIEEISELIERDFKLVGCTAIEDKLQDEVGPVIRDIKTSGVKFWVLTGDKIETAINIGFSCQLLDQDMEIFILNQTSSKAIYKQIVDFSSK